MSKNQHKLMPEDCKMDSEIEESMGLDEILSMDDQNYYAVNQI